jgi:hypothetical protein
LDEQFERAVLGNTAPRIAQRSAADWKCLNEKEAVGFSSVPKRILSPKAFAKTQKNGRVCSCLQIFPPLIEGRSPAQNINLHAQEIEGDITGDFGTYGVLFGSHNHRDIVLFAL